MKEQINTRLQLYDQRRRYPKVLIMFFALLHKGRPVSRPVPGIPGQTVEVDGQVNLGLITDGYIVFTEFGSVVAVRTFHRDIILEHNTMISHQFNDPMSDGDLGHNVPTLKRRGPFGYYDPLVGRFTPPGNLR